MTTKIAARYAKALFNSANPAGQEEILNDFEGMLAIYSKVPKLYSFLNSPEISLQQKKSVLNLSFRENSAFSGFLSLLLEKGRFKYLAAIAEKYRCIYTNAYGKTFAFLTSAAALDEATKERFKNKLNQIYHKKFELVCDVDPKILGGGVLVISNQMIDFSIKNKLDRLKNYLEKS